MRTYGIPFSIQGPSARLFPGPEELASAATDDLRALGLTGNKARAIIDFSHSVIDEKLHTEGWEEAGDQEISGLLQKMRGIGRWTAEYVFLRGLGRFHIFPRGDAGAQNKLKQWLDLKEPLDYA